MSDEKMIAFVRPKTHRATSTTRGTSTSAGVQPRARQAPVQASADALRADANWTADDLRTYVLRKVEERHGPQPDHGHPKMHSIFNKFHEVWGADAARIARYAFEGQARPGFWKGSPIKATRFTQGNYEWFAKAILDQINS
jgi:hypothetical protein